MGGILDLADRYLNGGRRKRRRLEERRREKDRSGGADAWLHDPDFLRAKARGILGIPDARCFTLQAVIRGLRGFQGDVAECGVRFGKSAAFLLEADPVVRAYRLFDSFEGLSEPSKEDVVSDLGASYWKKGDISAAESEARANLKEFPNVEFYRGWIPYRFDAVATCSFVLLHLDVDLYRPTLDSLNFFWPRLVPGGIVVCDDYGFTTCPGARSAMDEFFAELGVGIIELTTGQALAIKPGAAAAPA